MPSGSSRNLLNTSHCHAAADNNAVLTRSNREQSVSLSLEELIAAITGDELNDGTNVVRATLEDDTLQNVASVAEDQNTQQFVYEGLRYFDAGEVNHHLAATSQYLFSLLAYWCGSRSSPQHAAMRMGFQRETCAMFEGFHTYIIAQKR